MSESSSTIWLETADRIGGRIVRAAHWHRDACTWDVWVPARIPNVRRPELTQAAGAVYQGAAGTAIFLGELYSHSGSPQVLATARGALKHSAIAARMLPPVSFGFHAGRVGIAYAHYRLALLSEQPELFAAAAEILSPLVGQVSRSESLDVIGGAAGAIPFLLEMSKHLPARVTGDLAIALGEHLIRQARRTAYGWSWRGNASSVRDLSGFAHGASGYGHALLELWNSTGNELFRYGAEQAFLYERGTFDQAHGNWVDFRYLELSEWIGNGQTDELRAQLRAGMTLQPYTQRCMTAWCHGAPGIGLARLRAYELLGADKYADEAMIAVETTALSVREGSRGYSLCHGDLGNAETLLAAARVFKRPDLRSIAEERAWIGRRDYELSSKPWPCGTVGGAPDSSLLLGEAGIGYFYLRLHSESTPSILCPAPSGIHIDDASASDVRVIRRAYLEEHFAMTIRAFEGLDRDLPSTTETGESTYGQPDVVQLHDEIRQCIETETDMTTRAALIDASAVDRAAFELNTAGDDFSREFLDVLTRHEPNEIDWATVELELAERIMLVQTDYNWRHDIPKATAPGLEPPLNSSVMTRVFRAGGQTYSSELSAFAAIVLQSTIVRGTVAEIVLRVLATVQTDEPERIAALVLEQLKNAYRGRMLRVASTRGAP